MNEPVPRLVDERFAVNLRAARERLGLSQEQVAARMQAFGYKTFRQQVLGRMESAVRPPQSAGEIFYLAQALETNTDALLRPAGVASHAWALLSAAREYRDAAPAFRGAQERLKREMRRVRRAGLDEALADELTIARRALEEA